MARHHGMAAQLVRPDRRDRDRGAARPSKGDGPRRGPCRPGGLGPGLPSRPIARCQPREAVVSGAGPRRPALPGGEGGDRRGRCNRRRPISRPRSRALRADRHRPGCTRHDRPRIGSAHGRARLNRPRLGRNRRPSRHLRNTARIAVIGRRGALPRGHEHRLARRRARPLAGVGRGAVPRLGRDRADRHLCLRS